MVAVLIFNHVYFTMATKKRLSAIFELENFANT